MFGTGVCVLQYKDWYFALHSILFYVGRPISLIIGSLKPDLFIIYWYGAGWDRGDDSKLPAHGAIGKFT